jgi:predicted nucleic acid-binding protein
MPENPGPESLVFFDTNILLYLFDRGSKEKRRIAGELFHKHQQSGSLRLSLQVVNEFAANLLKKNFGVPRATVYDLVRDLLALEVTATRGEDTLTALQFVDELGVSFWDALILATAKREGCRTLYSEDFQDGRVYDTVRVINPFEGAIPR